MDTITIYQYPACSTCKKALKWIKEENLPLDIKHIVEETPNRNILKAIIRKSGLPLKKFFNTSGKRYRELNLKDKVGGMSLDEAVDLLSSDGMLIKRPLRIQGDSVLPGYREDERKEDLSR